MAVIINFDDLESFDEAVSPSNKALKRKRNVDKWKKNLKKKELYSADEKNFENRLLPWDTLAR